MSRLWRPKKGKPKPDNCGFCRQAIVKDGKHSGVFYSVASSETSEGQKIHTECWEAYHEKTAEKCLHCQGPVAHLPGRFNGKHFVCDDPAGKVHSECWEEFNRSRPATEKCSQCGKSLAIVAGKFSGNYIQLENGIKLHVECRSAYHEANTEKCLKCSEPVAPEKDKFSGAFFEVEGKGRVHAECYEDYAEATADKCLVCKKAVRKKEGFSGDFMLFEAGKVHKECASEYQEMMADKCLYCKKGVRKTGNFSGAFYPVDRDPEIGGGGRDPDVEQSEESQGKVHMECFEAYQAKLASDP